MDKQEMQQQIIDMIKRIDDIEILNLVHSSTFVALNLAIARYQQAEIQKADSLGIAE